LITSLSRFAKFCSAAIFPVYGLKFRNSLQVYNRAAGNAGAALWP